MSNVKYNISSNVRNQENKRVFRKARNSAINNVFEKYKIPKNMGNKEIKRRVKYSNWVGSKFRLYGPGFPGFYEDPGQSMNAKMKKYENRYAREKKGSLNTYTKFLMNDKILTENKRKDLVVLALQLGGNARGVLAVRNPVIVSYLMKLVSLYRNYYPEEFTGQLKSFGKYREDAAIISVLKKRIGFLKRLKNYGPIPNFVPNNIRNNLEPVLQKLGFRSYNILTEQRLKKLMDEIFPIPPHPKGNTAAKTIQKTVRGVRARTTVKKMKTVAGRVSLRGKRKRSPQ